MKIIKRNGAEVGFDITKIIIAITKANESVEEVDRMTPVQIQRIAESVDLQCQKMNRAPTVEEIQDMVEHYIMAHGAFEVAKHYITYRYTRSLVRKSNTTDDKILSLIECNNEEAKQENSNKNPVVNSTQRDYMAGEVSRDITNRILLPKDIVEAHNEGIIHFHDTDYYAQHMHNCDLVNLEDMLQNGTVITGTLIEKPHSFATACNIATQIVAQVASNQYGGQSISLTHLAPFVQISREKIRASVRDEFDAVGVAVTEDKINSIAEKRLREEIRRGVQTIQYQVVTLLTTNGQAPFVTVFMYLGEAKNQQEKDDLALIIEETLLQRYQGVKNEKGVWVTPAFPKLIYVLEEDNIREGSKYWELTKLAAKCTAKRMVPDYISEKKMLELKVDKNGNGHCYPCMGCRSFLTPYVDEDGNPKYYGRFNQGVVTVNLPDIALSSGGNIEKFWRIFDERMELCHRALLCRHENLVGFLLRRHHDRLFRDQRAGTLLGVADDILRLAFRGGHNVAAIRHDRLRLAQLGRQIGADIVHDLAQMIRRDQAFAAGQRHADRLINHIVNLFQQFVYFHACSFLPILLKISGKIAAGTNPEISPPSEATCLTRLEDRYICSALVVRNTVSTSALSLRLVSAIWNSYSKSDMARKPLTIALACRLRAYSASKPS